MFPDGVTLNDKSLWLFGNWSAAVGLTTDHNRTLDTNYTVQNTYAASLARYGCVRVLRLPVQVLFPFVGVKSHQETCIALAN